MLEKENKIGYRTVLKQKEYVKVLVANLISRFGDSIDAIAFTWLVYQVTGKASWSAIIFAVNQLPGIFVQPFVGPIVERMNKKRVLVVTDIIRAVIVILLAGLYVTNNINAWVLLLFTIIISTVESFNIPAATAIVPSIINLDYYEYSSSLSKSLGTAVELVGMAVAGGILALFGVHTAIAIDAATFAISAVILSFVNMGEAEISKAAMSAREYIGSLKEGVSYVKDYKIIRNFCILGAFANAALVPINSLQGPMVSELMGQGPEFLSFYGISLSVFIGVSSLAYPFISKKLEPLTTIVTAGLLVGLGVFSITFTRFFHDNAAMVYVIAFLSCMLIGVGAALLTSTLNVQFIKSVKPEYLARVASIFNAIVGAASPVTSFIVGLVAAVFSISQIFTVSAIIYFVIFIVLAIKKVDFGERNQG